GYGLAGGRFSEAPASCARLSGRGRWIHPSARAAFHSLFFLGHTVRPTAAERAIRAHRNASRKSSLSTQRSRASSCQRSQSADPSISDSSASRFERWLSLRSAFPLAL